MDMMDKLEMVGKLREYADITYEEAKSVLEEADWDLLNAVILLERLGKTKPHQPYTGSSDNETENSAHQNKEQDGHQEPVTTQVEEPELFTAQDEDQEPVTAQVEEPELITPQDEDQKQTQGMFREESREQDPGQESKDEPGQLPDISAVSEETDSTADTGETDTSRNAGTGKPSGFNGKKLRQTLKKAADILKSNFLRVSRKEKLLLVMPVWAFALILLIAWKPVIPIMFISLFFSVRYTFTGKDDFSPANDFMEKAGSIADEMKKEFHHAA